MLAGTGLLADAEEAVAEAAADRAPGDAQGDRRRRRDRDGRLRRPSRRSARRSTRVGRLARSNFGSGGVFLERLVRLGAARRGAAVRRRRRTGRGLRGPRLLAATAPPEGHRGGAGARRFPDHVRELLHDSARTLADRVGYRSAGTVEFVYDPARAGGVVPGGQHPPAGRAPGDRGGLRRRSRRPDAAPGPRRRRRAGRRRVRRARQPAGHAVEARVYAEDPGKGGLPSSGLVTSAVFPGQGTGAAGRDPGRRLGRDRDGGLAVLRSDARQGDRRRRRAGTTRWTCCARAWTPAASTASSRTWGCSGP